MNEYHIGYIAVGSLIGLSITALLYMIGGRNNKGIRRFGASAALTATICASAYFMGCFSWFMILLYPLFIAQFVQGYSDNSGFGWFKRIMISSTSIAAGIALCFILKGGWWILAIHSPISIMTAYFALKNPIHAAAEETFVCVINNLAILFYVFIA